MIVQWARNPRGCRVFNANLVSINLIMAHMLAFGVAGDSLLREAGQRGMKLVLREATNPITGQFHANCVLLVISQMDPRDLLVQFAPQLSIARKDLEVKLFVLPVHINQILDRHPAYRVQQELIQHGELHLAQYAPLAHFAPILRTIQWSVPLANISQITGPHRVLIVHLEKTRVEEQQAVGFSVDLVNFWFQDLNNVKTVKKESISHSMDNRFVFSALQEQQATHWDAILVILAAAH